MCETWNSKCDFILRFCDKDYLLKHETFRMGWPKGNKKGPSYSTVGTTLKMTCNVHPKNVGENIKNFNDL